MAVLRARSLSRAAGKDESRALGVERETEKRREGETQKEKKRRKGAAVRLGKALL